jgi:type II secretory pathway pseudopilin PulG
MLRRMILVLSVVALMAAMMIPSAMPAFAAKEKAKENKENSCGRAVSEVRTDFDEFNDCGIKNNPNYEKNVFPPGGGLEEG